MYHIIVNPASKTGKGKRIWSDLEPILVDNGVDYKVYFSKKPGHVMELVHDLTGYSLAGSPEAVLNLIVLGGDGTLNEVLQGIKDFDRVNIGYIPTGSRDLKLPVDPAECLKNILNCKIPVKMDLGYLEYEGDPVDFVKKGSSSAIPERKRYFDVSMGIGYDAAVCIEAMSSPIKKALNRIGIGKLAYLFIALKQLIKTETVDAELILDDKEPIKLDRFLLAACMIHKYEGGGFKFCPGADYQDGIIDICTAYGISKLTILRGLPLALKGKHFSIKGIEKYSAQKIHIKVSKPCWVHTDGEVSMKNDSVTIQCLKQKINLLK